MNKPVALTIWIISSYQLLDEAMTALLSGMPGFNIWDDVDTDTTPDVILLAIPDPLDLSETLTTIMQQHPDSRVLCLLWDWTPQLVHSALLAGATGCLEAHLTTADFVAALRQASRGEVTLSPELQRSLIIEMLGEHISHPNLNFNSLSPREQEVLALICKGQSNKQIAQRLYLSVRTVENHLRRLYQKMGVSSRTEAAVLAIQQKWVEKD